MDNKDYGFHHSFSAHDDHLGMFPEDQPQDRRLGFEVQKGYVGLQQSSYSVQPPYEPSPWAPANDSFANKPIYNQSYPSNNGRQDSGFYGNQPADNFPQYGFQGANAGKRANKYDDIGVNSLAPKDLYYPQNQGYHDAGMQGMQGMQNKPLLRPQPPMQQHQQQHGHLPMPPVYHSQHPQMQGQMNRGGMNQGMNQGMNMGMGQGMNQGMNNNRGVYPSHANGGMNQNAYGMRPSPMPNMGMFPNGTGGSNAQGRAINKMLLEILRERVIDPQRLDMAIETYVDRMDCVNLATLLFHTGKKRLLLMPHYVKRVAGRFVTLKEELRAREASNALYGLKCMTSELAEVRELVYALATKVTASCTDFVAQAVGNALYGLQMMSSEHEEVRYMLTVLAVKVSRCTELLEAQNVGNALYGLRNMSSDYREVRTIIAALTPRIATAREDLNGQALGNSLYGLQSMCSKEAEVRFLLAVLATKVTRTWEDLKAQEVGNALYGLKRMSTDVPEVRMLISALVPKVAASPEILDAQAIGNSFYGLQNMRSDNPEVLSLLAVMADKVAMSCPELDGQAMGNSLYGLQGMSSDHPEVRAVVSALTAKMQASCLDMNAQELGNALYGLQNMTSEHADVRRLLTALTHKVNSSKHDLTSQEIGNAMFGLQGMSSSVWETRMLVRQIAIKIQQSHSIIDPLGVANSLFGLQRMSSESEDVRLLVQALATKIEHSWKLLGAQHIANALYGVQGLSSMESEVRYLIKALVTKVASCRDEMSAKQLSQAIFGLRSFSSEHAEVLALAAAMAEKVTASTEPWQLSHLSMVMFGLQGMSSNKEEVALLLSAIAQKAADITPEKTVDTSALANCLFGFQRMNANNADVCRILTALYPKMQMVPHTAVVSARACANMIFGMQALSCANETVKRMLYCVSDWMQQVSSTFMTAPRSHQGDMYGLDKTGEAIIPADRIEEILALYQSATLSLFAMRDLESDADLQARLYAELSALRSIVDIHKTDIPPPVLTAAEKRMTRELSDMLSREPYNVITGVVVHGFEMSAYIQLFNGLQLKTAAGNLWSPVLNLEVRGSSYSFPAKELFFRLRKHYLEQERGIAVDSVPADSFRIEGQQGLKIHSAVLSPLYPPTMEDATHFASRLNSLSKSGQLGLPSIGPEGFFSFTGGNSMDFAQDMSASNGMPPLEYHDDDFKKTPTGNGMDNKKYKFNQSARGQKVPLGLPLSWLGEWPTVTQPAASSQYPGAAAGNSPAVSPKMQDDRSLNFAVQGGSGGLLGRPDANISNNITGGLNNSLATSTIAPGSQYPMNRSYQGELNAVSPRSPPSANRLLSGAAISKPVGYRAADEDSDSSQGSLHRSSSHHHSNQSSGSVEPYLAASAGLGDNRFSASQQSLGVTANLTRLDISGISSLAKAEVKSGSADSVTSVQNTIVLGFANTPSNAYVASQYAGTGSQLNTARVGESTEPASATEDNSEMDDEIAALEAQLEVARLEARIKELKSKKGGKAVAAAPRSGMAEQL